MYSVHSLIHLLADDVRHFGPLDNVSAFPFESYLYQLKKIVRKSHQILPQILNRLRERKVVDRQNRKSVRGMIKECCTNPTFIEFRGYKSYCKVYLDEFCIKTKTGDNCVSIHGNVALVRNLVRSDADDWVIYEKFSSVEPFFVEPLFCRFVSSESK